MNETKADNVDNETIKEAFDSYICVFKNRKERVNKSGGIAVFIKKKYKTQCNFHTTNCKYVQWVTIDKSVFGYDKDVLVGGVYIPPENSRYVDGECFNEISDEMSTLSNDKLVLLLGDFNAHTKSQEDTVMIDDFILNETDVVLDDEDVSEIVTKSRNSKDVHALNRHGRLLIEFCQSHGIVIYNGRTGNDDGDFTTTKKSIVDYIVGSGILWTYVKEFEILPFNAMCSDIHCPITFSCINNNYDHSLIPEVTVIGGPDDVKPNVGLQRSGIHWDSRKKDVYIENIDVNGINDLMEMLQNDIDVDVVTNQLSDILVKAAKETFEYRKRKKNDENGKPWFDGDCRKSKRVYNRARNRYKRFRCEENFNLVKEKNKMYKRCINRSFKKYQQEFRNKLRKCKNSNPKLYWNLLNNGKKNVCKVSINDLFEHFKDINSKEYGGDVDIESLIDIANINDILDVDIEECEIRKAVKTLKTGKACGIDGILNEYIVNTLDMLIPVYKILFNTVLSTGVIPSDWLIGIVIPIFKKKGSEKEANNYRDITLLSCLGKLFTGILNERLCKFSDTCNLIKENQAAFRKGYSTLDHIFLVKSLVDIYFARKKKLYCAFVDYEKAFPSIWRTGLWMKLLENGIEGRLFKVVYNMYKDVKSCVFSNNEYSDFFISHNGVRQGENLSPMLFAIFVNDLESHLWSNGVSAVELSEPDLDCYLKLSVIMYADDTVLISDSPKGLQDALDSLLLYTKRWKLKVNEDKTKVLIFCKRTTKKLKELQFKLGNTKLENVNTYKYLGLIFTPNGRFKESIKYLCNQAQKAMFSVIKKARNLQLPLDVQLHLFHSTVMPIALYGCEVWGYEDCGMVERLHLKFCKYLLRVKSSTPSFMVYGELGEFPTSITIKCRMINFWLRLLNGKNSKYSKIIYHMLLLMDHNNVGKFAWITYIRHILSENGFNNVWREPLNYNRYWVDHVFKQCLKDQFVQTWNENVYESSKGINYRIFKTKFGYEPYFNVLPFNLSNVLCKFRTCNHRLPIEAGRFVNLPRKERTCTCSNKLGDEFHFIFECRHVQNLRSKYLDIDDVNCANTFNFYNIMNSTDSNFLLNLAKFIKEGLMLCNV